MSYPLDISIGQRLALSFGLLLLMLAVFVGVVSNWNARSANAQDALAQRIIPLEEQAALLERALLQVGVGVRAHILTPSDDVQQAYRRAETRARLALQHLGELPKNADLEARYSDVASRVDAYLDHAGRIVERSSTQPIGAFEERRLTDMRGAAADEVNTFGALLDGQLHAGLSAMASARDNATQGLWMASVFIALFFGLVGHFTARSIRRPTQRLLHVATALEAGDWRPALVWAPPRNGAKRAPVTGRNEIVRLGRAFSAAAAALEGREQRMQADARVAAATAASLEKEKVAEAALAGIVDHIGAEVGAVYWCERNTQMLHPIARHALNGQAVAVPIGEGVPGQAAKERRAVVARDIPRDSPFSVKLGYDQAPPKAVAAVPVSFGDELHGVILVASLRDIGRESAAFLNDAARQLGMGLQNARAHAETERLLADVRAKSEQIQGQNEELQAQNEEIQAQNEEIQAQTEEIQSQNEEIQTQNEELQRHTEELGVRAEMLAQADARKNEFLGVLAHELRNPLAAITNSLVIAKRTPPGSEQSARAQMVIERQAQQLVRLIDDLLDVTRISQGKIQIRRDRLDLVEVVHTCIEDQRAELEANELTVELDLPGGEVWVEGDRTRLCQVLGNLLNNAIKFTDAGNQVMVALRPHPEEAQVALHVIDRGIGIDTDLLPQLFQPFNQGKAAGDKANTGLGLGLALVKELVRLHGGSVEARSDGCGTGSEFIVRLPLHAAAHEADATEPLHSTSRRILLVEDNVDVAHTLQDVLALEGHEVELAHSGAEALARASAMQPHVVLCDIGLPEMDGYEVAQKLRADRRLRPALLIALTGYASKIDKERAAHAGFDYHLPKPPSIERIRAIFTELEERRSAAPGA